MDPRSGDPANVPVEHYHILLAQIASLEGEVQKVQERAEKAEERAEKAEKNLCEKRTREERLDVIHPFQERQALVSDLIQTIQRTQYDDLPTNCEEAIKTEMQHYFKKT